MLKIGNLKLSSNLILAPMAGITDLPFRMFCREFGVELAFIEMLNVRSLGYKSKRTQYMLSTCKGDSPLGVQILGCEPRYIQRGLDILRNYKFDILDFNAACPMKKIITRGEGASLLKEPKKLNKLLKMVVENSQVPVTVKIRTGWDKNSINAREVALSAQDAGISALFIHGRLKSQIYSGEVDYQAISSVKKALEIPVIASGDVFSGELAKKMFDETGCDGLLIARGGLGNPWIFQEIADFLNGKSTFKKPQLAKKTSAMLKQLEMCIDFHGERIGVVVFRKFFGWYTKGLHTVRLLRCKANLAKTKDEMVNLILQIR